MKRVQDPKEKCTDSAIAQSVQVVTSPSVQNEAAAFVLVQEFRSKMRAYLTGEVPVILGNRWRPRGVVLPLRPSWLWGTDRVRVRNARLREMLEAVIREL